MGREIRRVPKDWDHPRNNMGHFQPLYDCSFKEAVGDWVELVRKFLEENPSGFTPDGYTFLECEDSHPEREWYRPEWTEDEASGYQVYENVTEGTPVSPVFDTADELRIWLIGEWGLSEQAADHFIKTGYSFSMIMIDGEIHGPGAPAIEAMARMDSDSAEQGNAPEPGG